MMLMTKSLAVLQGDKKAKESVPVPASTPQAGSGNEEGEDEEDGE